MTAPISTAAPATGGRFVAASDQLELVGVLQGRRLVLYLDRFADNAPVPDARIELELGTQRLRAVADGDRHTIELDSPLPTGTLPVVATVIAGDISDLLAGELNVAPGEPALQGRPPTVRGGADGGAAAGSAGSLDRIGDISWRGVAIGGGVVAAAALGWLIGRRGRRA